MQAIIVPLAREMKAEVLIANRIIRGRAKKGRNAGPVLKIAVSALTLGVSVMLMALAIVKGFQLEISTKVIGFGAHILISKFDANASLEKSPIAMADVDKAAIEGIAGVRKIYPFAQKPGIIKHDDAIEGVLFKGFAQTSDLTFFGQQLVRGRLPLLEADSERSNELLMSLRLAEELGLDTGSTCLIHFVQDPPKTRKFSICGLYDSGLHENDFDKLYVLGDLRQVQRLNGWTAGQVSGFEVLVNRREDIIPAQTQIDELLPYDLIAENIMSRYPEIFSWLELMDMNVVIIIVLMLVVSIINIMAALMIMMMENTQLIALLKVLGANQQFLRSIFLRQSFYIISRGLLWGNALGIGFCLFQHQTHFFKLNQSTYYVDHVPIYFDIAGWLLLNAGVLFICLCCMLIPSTLLGRISPARVMRFQ